jgi:NAD+ synthase
MGGSVGGELGVTSTFDVDGEVERRTVFLAELLRDHSCLVLGISGGVDSATAGRLCQLAAQRVRASGGTAAFIAMRLPYGTQHDEADARAALAFIEPDEVLTVDIRPASDATLQSLTMGGLVFRDHHEQDFVLGNIKARQRMIVQYAVAGTRRGLVVGTDHAAEAVMGFYTKYGDGAADVLPLAGLTKRRVRAIAEALGAPKALVHKTPTADLESLRPGHPDEDAYGVSYEQIDDFLEGNGVAPEVERIILDQFSASAHKRQLPLAFG